MIGPVDFDIKNMKFDITKRVRMPIRERQDPQPVDLWNAMTSLISAVVHLRICNWNQLSPQRRAKQATDVPLSNETSFIFPFLIH
jgi:hypothetical protein